MTGIRQEVDWNKSFDEYQLGHFSQKYEICPQILDDFEIVVG